MDPQREPAPPHAAHPDVVAAYAFSTRKHPASPRIQLLRRRLVESIDTRFMQITHDSGTQRSLKGDRDSLRFRAKSKIKIPTTRACRPGPGR